MFWKKLGIILLILILPVLAKWHFDSKDIGRMLIFSMDKKPVITKTKDDLFGTEVEKTEWKDGFWLGLLPNDDSISIKAVIGVAPISGILIVLSTFSFYKYYRFKKGS